jgi:hypothetical protein
MFGMNRTELAKRIEELEVNINETDALIKEAYLASELMVEPTKSDFIRDLLLKEMQLNSNRLMLAQFKIILGG